MVAGAFIKRLRRYVEAVRPDHGTHLRVEASLGEESRVGQWLRNPSPAATRKVDVAHEPILKGDAKLVVTDDLDARDIDEYVHDWHASEAERSD
jgi:hypothetical protein